MNTQQMLEEAIEHFGLDDIVTKLLSIKRDKEIAVEQRLFMGGTSNGRLNTSLYDNAPNGIIFPAWSNYNNANYGSSNLYKER